MSTNGRAIPIRNVFLAAALVILAACSVTTEPAYAEVETAPPNIETYPQTVYEGRTVYLVNEHWYYRHGNHWAYYRQEPEYLVRQRSTVRHAPPAPAREHGREHEHEHGEERREGPPPR